MKHHHVLSRIVAVALGLCFAVAAPLGAQGRGHGSEQKPAKHAKPDKSDKPGKSGKSAKPAKGAKADTSHTIPAPPAVVIDRDGHVRAIREYARAGSLPPGLAKREALPPGLRAQLHERGTLPPGLQKRLVPVPAPLVVRLPPAPAYYHRYFAGDDFIVIDSRTNRIVAIVPDVWR